MGLAKPALRFLSIEHRRQSFEGKLLTLGRQCVYATFAQVQSLLFEEGIDPAPLPSGQELGTNIPSWRGTSMEGFTSDVVFFKLLGLSDVQAMDCNDYEGAEIVADLNLPIPQELRSRFDVIVDGGTIEHVFDIRQCLMNIVAMLKPGGRIVHMCPSNNFTNHGFYQISPTLFVDYYTANGFSDVRPFIADEHLRDDQTARWDLYQFESAQQPLLLMSPRKRRILTICVAQKGTRSSADRVPLQSTYEHLFSNLRTSQHTDEESEAMRIPRRQINRLAKRTLPPGLYKFLRQSWIRLQRRIPGRDPHQLPWGLKYWRRLD